MSKFGGIPLDGGSRFGGIPLQSEPQEQMPQGTELQGNMEVAATLLNPLPLGGAIAGGLLSLPVLVAEQFGFADEGAAVELINSFKEASEYQPTTQAGMNKLNQFMQSPPMQKMGELMQAYEDSMGYISEATSPEYAAALKGVIAAPQVLPVAAGLKTASAIKNNIPQGSKKQDIGKLLSTGQTDSSTAGFMLENPQSRSSSMELNEPQFYDDVPELGPSQADPNLTRADIRVQKFPEAKALKSYGFDDKFIAGIQQYTKDESPIARKMASVKNSSISNMNMTSQPLELVGNVLKDQIDVISKAKSKAGKRVGKALKEMEGKDLYYGDALDSWISDLDRQGVKLSEFEVSDDGLDFNFDLRRSKFNKDTGTQRLLDIISDRLSLISQDRGGYSSATPKDLHELKKLIDYRVDWSKNQIAGEDSLSNEGAQLAKNLRGSINEVLRQGSKNYEAANADYTKAIKPLAELNDATGSKLRILDDDLSADALGLELRKMNGNWQSTPALQSAAKNVTLEAKNRGYNKNINLDRLVTFNGQLDKRFGVSANKQNTLQGNFEAAINPVRAGVDMVIDKIAETKYSDKQAMSKLIKLLSEKSKNQ